MRVVLYFEFTLLCYVCWKKLSPVHVWVCLHAIFVNLQKLLQRGQERDQFLAEMSQRADSDHVLELRQTIQIMQEKLDERQGEAFRPFKSPRWIFKVRVHGGHIFDSVLSEQKLSCPGETVTIVRKTIHSPRKQLLSWRRSWHRKLKHWTKHWRGKTNWRSVSWKHLLYIQYWDIICWS